MPRHRRRTLWARRFGWRLALRDTRIVAPVDGWVSARNAEEGQSLTPGQAVVTISPAHRIFVTANYKETQINRIGPGMPVTSPWTHAAVPKYEVR